jgi:hypothetical protein
MKENKGVFTKILAIAGTILVWIPILAPVLFSGILLIQAHVFHFDYLMPAELFLFALLGGVLLIWAARRARARWGFIGWGLAIAIGMLVGGQVLAVVTGLASGEAEPVGWQWALVLTTLGIFSLALVVMGVDALLLLRDLFRTQRPPAGEVNSQA